MPMMRLKETLYQKIIETVNDAKYYNYKATIIVKGGAGTGKSAAINTLGQLLNSKHGKRLNCAYFTANGAPRYLFILF